MPNSDPKAKMRLQIDENLKRIYDDTLHEDIPDRFTRLLDQLRQKPQADSAAGSSGDAEDV